MTNAVDPARSLVLAVGIERYDYGSRLDLPGAAAEAGRFAEWAVRCGVPPDRVLLACSRLDDSPPPPAGVTSIDATRQTLEREIIRIGRRDGDLLMIFWCGHGVLNEERERALFTSDATPALKTNVLVDDMLGYLSSTLITGFDQQILLIDACANFVQNMTFDSSLPRYSLPKGGDRRIAQNSYYAVAQGEFAKFDPVRGRAVFSEAVLGWLEQHSDGALPPDFEALTGHVNGIFADLRAGGGQQTPVYRKVISDGNEVEYGTPIVNAPILGTKEIREAMAAELDSRSFTSSENTVKATAGRIAAQAEREGREQLAQLGLRALLQLRFRPASGDIVARLPTTRTAHLAGQLDDIAEVYRRTSGRLVILGEPGAGKSVLARRLALDLLASRGSGEQRVPVVVNLHSWDLEKDTFDKWLAKALALAFNGLSEIGPDKKSRAAELIDAEHILPILDGFDEIVDRLRGPILVELNHTSTPLVLTSRTSAYAAAVQAGAALEDADVIVLDDLAVADLREYLSRIAQTPVAKAKWKPVLARLAGGGDLGGLRTLLSPLMAGLARAIYNDGLDEPRELIDDTARFADPESVRAHLLSRFVPAVYQRPRSRWEGRDAQRWLGYLAHRRGHVDVAWWKLADSVPGYQRAGAFLLPSALLGAVAGGIRFGWTGLMIGALAVAILGVITGLTRGPEPERMQVKLTGRAKHALVQVVPGVIGGLIAGIAGFFVVSEWGWWALPLAGAFGNAVGSGLTGLARHRAWENKAKAIRREIIFGVGGGAAGGLAVGLIGLIAHAPTGEYGALWPVAGIIVGLAFTPGAGLLAEPGVETVLTPASLLESNRNYAILQTILVGIGYGIVIGLFTGVANGIVFGIAIGIAFGVGAHAWGRWLIIGRFWLPLIGRLPWLRVWAFLDDAHARGVLRQDGAVYAFRHTLLRETLAANYAQGRRTRP